MKLLLIFLFSLIIISYSCKEYPCDTAIINIDIRGFSKNDIDSIIVRKYVKSTNFGTLLQSCSIDSLQASYYWIGDFLQVIPAFGNEYGLRSNFDYEVYIPRENRTFKITEMTEELATGKRTLAMDQSNCINPINEYKVNGQLISGDSYHFVELFK